MRKIGLIGLMLVLLAACSSSGDSVDVVPEPDNGNGNNSGNSSYEPSQRSIGFVGQFADDEGGAAAARATRGAMRRAGEPEPGDGEFTTTDLQTSGFGVYCWYTGAKEYLTGHIKDYTDNILMLNQKVEYKNSQWTYAPSKYWPLKDNEKLTFRAYAPYVSYQLQTDETTGLPMLPVVVTKDDYHNGTQHDPLWGTAKYGGSDGDEGTTYGVLYDNYTYTMSGSTTGKDARDGIVDWYFHHGMSKLMFTCSVIQDPGCDNVTIKSIKIESLYTQGLLSLSSGTTQKADKPDWEQKAGDMTVTLNGATTEDEGHTWTAGDLAPIPDPEHPENPHPTTPYPFVITIDNPSQPTPYIPLLSKGLLIIPRNHLIGDGLKITVTYTIDTDTTPLEATATVKNNFQGNTSYTLGLSLTPSTKGLEITMVQSAFTTWSDGGEIERWVYNW